MAKKCCKVTVGFHSVQGAPVIVQDVNLYCNLVVLAKVNKSREQSWVFMQTAKSLFECNLKGKTSIKWSDIKKGDTKKIYEVLRNDLKNGRLTEEMMK